MHTGFKKMFQTTLDGVSSIINPAKLRWIGFSHFESDECGALNQLLGVAPHAQAVCSVVGAIVMVNDFADRRGRLPIMKSCKPADTVFNFLQPRMCRTAGTQVCSSMKQNGHCSARISSSSLAIPNRLSSPTSLSARETQSTAALMGRWRRTCPTPHTLTAHSNGSLPWSQQRWRLCTVLRSGATVGRPFLTLLL